MSEHDKVREALERAAAELPEGFIVSVQVERGAGWVCLEDYGRPVPFEDADLSLAQAVEAAIAAAHEVDAMRGGAE